MKARKIHPGHVLCMDSVTPRAASQWLFAFFPLEAGDVPGKQPSSKKYSCVTTKNLYPILSTYCDDKLGNGVYEFQGEPQGLQSSKVPRDKDLQ